MKTKRYNIYKAGSTQVATIMAGCITKAAERFIATLERQASCEVENRQHATIRYADNHNLMSDFVIIEA